MSEITPALSAEEWSEGLHQQDPSGNWGERYELAEGCIALTCDNCITHSHGVRSTERKDLAAIIALCNAALPDEGPRKITWAMVDDLRHVAACTERDAIALYRERPDDPNGDKAIASLRALADILASYLPPR